ncbi:MAG: HYR domain-containing protein, partial [Bacteroidetes bacterium]
DGGINNLGTHLFNLGVTTVTYYAEDLAGNSATCTFDVTVELLPPAITLVAIPNVSMKINDLVTATLTVRNDGNKPYIFVSGSIGGYPLISSSFTRGNATTYFINFLVTEGGNSYLAGQNIPVSNLVITDGTVQSLPYNTPISQPGDPLDAVRPVVSSLQVQGGTKKIGDQVTLSIVSDGIGYTADPQTTINGISVTADNVTLVSAGGNNYELRYTVQEGDTDVGPGELEATVVLRDPAGNISQAYTTVGNTGNLTIDAHPPVVMRMEVPDVEVGVGGEVQITVTADLPGYEAVSGTVVNGISLSSSTVEFTEQGGGLYLLSYTVGIADNDVPPGGLEVSLVLADPAGNTNTTYSILQANELEVYTTLPTAVLAGTPAICEGEMAEMQVFLTGRSPWSFAISNGTTTQEFSGITVSTYRFDLSPATTSTYTIPLVTDRNGVLNIGSGSVKVTVNEQTDVEIINLATGYSVEADPFPLQANIMGGVFSGPGVVSATGRFDPGLADTVNSPHTIYYTYTNTKGCTSMDSARVFVLGAEGDIYIPSGIVCDYGDPFEVLASNVAGVMGSFRLLEGSQPVAGLTDHGDNTAEIDPGLLEAGGYTIEYEYIDQVTLYLRAGFVIESVAEPSFVGFTKSVFCQNDPPVELNSNIPGAVFSGSGVTGNVTDGFVFDPSQASLGSVIITCSVTTAGGCVGSSTRQVSVRFAPALNFTVSTSCIPVEGGNVAFSNLTGGKLLVETWSWNFDDINSGENNFSILVEPVHFYQQPGARSINLTATTFDGCLASLDLDTVFGGQPVSDFTWTSECVTAGSEIAF